MLALLWYLLTCCIPALWILESSLGNFLSLSEIIAASICLGTAGGAWIVFVVSSTYGRLTLGTILFSTLVMVGMGLINAKKVVRSLQICTASFQSTMHTIFQRKRKDSSKSTHQVRSPLWALLTSRDSFIIILTIVMGCLTYPLYHMRMIREVDGGLISANSCYGDLPIHMQIANSFLIGGNQNMSWGNLESPIFAKMPLTYPFLADFHAAIFVRLGGTLRMGFLYPGFLMTCSLWALLAAFTTRVSKSKFGALLGLFLTIGAGGLGGPRWIWEKGWATAMSNDVVQHDWVSEWIHLWFAFIPHILLPQRGGNFAYPIVVLVFLLIWIGTDEQAAPNSKSPPHSNASLPGTNPLTRTRSQQKVFFSFSSSRNQYRSLASGVDSPIPSDLLPYAGIFTAMLPLIQAHSFIGIGIIVAFVALLDFHKWLRNPSILRNWILAGVLVVVLAGPQTLLFRKTVEEGAYGSFFTYGWLFTKDLYLEFGTPHNPIGFMRFWIHSLGFLLPMYFLGTAILLLRMKRASDSYFAGSLHLNLLHSPHEKSSMLFASYSSGIVPSLCRKIDSTLARFCSAKDNNMFRRLSAWNHPVMVPILSDKPTSRAWDVLKFWLGAFAVFLVANYINFQPWDRDNSKIYYVFIFVSSTIVGPLLALPFEHYFRIALENTTLSTYSNMKSELSSPISLTAPEAHRSSYTSEGVASDHQQGSTLYREDSHWASSQRNRLGSDVFLPVSTDVGSRSSILRSPDADSVQDLSQSAYSDSESPMLAGVLHSHFDAVGSSPSFATQSLRQRAPLTLDSQTSDATSPSQPLFSELSTTSAAFRHHSPNLDLGYPKKTLASQRTHLVYGTFARVTILCALFLSPVIFLSSTMSGLMLLAQEYFTGREGYLFDKHAVAYGNWITENVSPDALIMHSNSHIQPSASIAGYTSFVSYFGWVNNHGYNSYERMDDRNYVMDNLKKMSDPHSISLLKKWGITHISGFYIKDHRENRSKIIADAEAQKDNSKAWVRDSDLFLDGAVRRIYSSHGWELFEVVEKD